MIHLTRTFHPVGFGAFYTEKHKSNNGETLTIVYDCGTKAGSNIKNIIHEAFPEKDTVIDILFISHFHKDHINGIEELMKHCIIKKVVIPYIPEENRLLFVFVEELHAFRMLITNTEDYFGPSSEIIRIVSQHNERYVDFKKVLYTGKELPLPSGVFSRWHFIPLNYDYATRIEALKKDLINQGLSYKELTNEDYIRKNYECVKRVYKELKGNQNETSMLLFSFTENPCDVCCRDCRLSKRRLNCMCNLNCMYCGDATMKNNDLINDIKKRIGSKLNSFHTIQIPHHGSKASFSPVFLQVGSFAVICHKSGSPKHPDPSVVHSIVKEKRAIYVSVTEDKNTIFIEQGWY